MRIEEYVGDEIQHFTAACLLINAANSYKDTSPLPRSQLLINYESHTIKIVCLRSIGYIMAGGVNEERSAIIRSKGQKRSFDAVRGACFAF